MIYEDIKANFVFYHLLYTIFAVTCLLQTEGLCFQCFGFKTLIPNMVVSRAEVFRSN